jgi:hypothetical protein|tara:strand:- start:15134 stop:15871 length:738 start_codon:yes stop_codon:yes gene_type:complete
MKKLTVLIAFSFCINLFAQKEFYELRTYELYQTSNFKDFNSYFKDYFIPAMNQNGINNIGVFKEASEDFPRKIYVFIAYPDMTTYQSVKHSIKNDPKNSAASVRLNKKEKPVFNRYDTSLYDAFDGLPKMVKPEAQKRFFELRTYESHSEDAYRRKVNMFNEGEIDLFDELDFGSVFFGEKISGDRMPCLTYMLAFESLEDRNNSWALFPKHPKWQQLKNDEAYKDSCCSSITRVYLLPMPYSQL